MTKEPWGSGTPWKTSTAFFTYLRGCLRKSWSRHPTRIAVINKKRRQIDNPNKGHKKSVWGFDCEICGETYVIKLAQVDHIKPAGSLTKTEDIQGFVERLLYVTEDDLRLVCKSCNVTLAYADRMKMSFDDARSHKQAIEIDKKSSKEVIAFLTKNGYNAARTKEERKLQLIAHFLKGDSNES